MNSILEKIPIANIIVPGDMYILNGIKSSRGTIDSMDYLYFIKADEEIIPAIKLEISFTDYTLKKFIGWKRITPSCVEFTFFSYDKEEKKYVMHSLYLHRIKTVQEALQEAFEE
jgi:hypothetical protein